MKGRPIIKLTSNSRLCEKETQEDLLRMCSADEAAPSTHTSTMCLSSGSRSVHGCHTVPWDLAISLVPDTALLIPLWTQHRCLQSSVYSGQPSRRLIVPCTACGWGPMCWVPVRGWKRTLSSCFFDRGSSTLHWKLPGRHVVSDGVLMNKTGCKKLGYSHCSQLIVRNSRHNDTGPYSCGSAHHGDSHDSYIFVKGETDIVEWHIMMAFVGWEGLSCPQISQCKFSG